MKEILDKLSSYNVFNYLFPGIIFTTLYNSSTIYSISIDNIFESVFIYYFIGLIISRIGSLIIEPIFKKLKIISFNSYEKFVEVSNLDEKLNLFSEINNMYRTLVSVLFCLILLTIYDELVSTYPILTIPSIVKLILLFVLFVLSYKKQTDFITNRITSQSVKKEEN